MVSFGRYCDCFANGEFCHGCNCVSCANNLEHEELRLRAIRSCLDRNPHAFKPKIGVGWGAEPRRHNKGCHCKRSGCLKNYCECYEVWTMKTEFRVEFSFIRLDFRPKSLARICASASGAKIASMGSALRGRPRRRIPPKWLRQSWQDRAVHPWMVGRSAAAWWLTTSKWKTVEGVATLRKVLLLWPHPERGRKFGRISRFISITHVYVSFSRPPFSFITQEVVEATCQCLLAQAEEADRMGRSSVETEGMVLEEFGRCLLQIIEYASKAKGIQI